jgi:hypothetical protein
MTLRPPFRDGDSADEMDGDAHHRNEADDGRKGQGFAGETDHVNNSQNDVSDLF